MTNIDFSDIISALISSISKKEGSIKISLEVNADTEGIDLPHCKLGYTCKMNLGMKELHTSLKGVTYYLVQFFYKTEKKYSCTQTKLGKLLSILAFKYAKNKILLFDEIIYEYPSHCGTLIKALTFVPQNIYVRGLSEPSNDRPTENNDEFIDVIVPSQYTSVIDLSDSIKNEIEQVFRYFGAYSGDDLANNLNPIVDKIIKKDSGELDLSLLSSLTQTDFNISDDNNKIVNYIYK